MKKVLAAFLLLILCIQASARTGGFVKYRVKWYDSLSSISAKFKVPKDVIARQNHLTGDELTPKMELYIPESEEFWDVTPPPRNGSDSTGGKPAVNAAIYEGTVIAAEGAVAADAALATDSGSEDSTLVSLPEQNDNVLNSNEMTVELILSANSPFQKRNDASLDYYAGILMAMDGMKDRDIKLSLHVRDIEDYRQSPVTAYRYDFTMGPVRCEDVEELAAGLDSNCVIVSPLDPNVLKLLPEHPNIIQAAPTSTSQLKDMIDWSVEDFGHSASNNYVVMTSARDSLSFRTLSGLLHSRGIAFNTVTVSTAADKKPGVSAEQEKNIDRAANSLASFCIEGANNIIIVAISAEAELSDAIRNLSILKDLHEFSVYCNSKVLSYDNIPVDHLHRLKVNVSCGYCVDYNDEEVRSFIRRYRSFFKREPSEYSFHGYDLFNFIVDCRRAYGVNFAERMTEMPWRHGLQVNFRFHRSEEGALSNEGIRRLRYLDNYELEYLK